MIAIGIVARASVGRMRCLIATHITDHWAEIRALTISMLEMNSAAVDAKPSPLSSSPQTSQNGSGRTPGGIRPEAGRAKGVSARTMAKR